MEFCVDDKVVSMHAKLELALCQLNFLLQFQS